MTCHFWEIDKNKNTNKKLFYHLSNLIINSIFCSFLHRCCKTLHNALYCSQFNFSHLTQKYYSFQLTIKASSKSSEVVLFIGHTKKFRILFTIIYPAASDSSGRVVVVVGFVLWSLSCIPLVIISWVCFLSLPPPSSSTRLAQYCSGSAKQIQTDKIYLIYSLELSGKKMLQIERFSQREWNYTWFTFLG